MIGGISIAYQTRHAILCNHQQLALVANAAGTDPGSGNRIIHLGVGMKTDAAATIAALQTENAQLRQQLHDAQQGRKFLQSVIENIPAAIYAKDLQGRYLLTNRHLSSLLDLMPEQIIGQYDSDLFPAEVVAHWHELQQQVIATESLVSHEEILPQADGIHTFLSSLFPIYNEHHTLIAIGGISADITERKQIERSMHENQALLQAVIDNASVLVLVKDTTGRYTVVNRLAAAAVKLTPAQMIGKTDYDVLPADIADAYHKDDQQVLTTGTIIHVEHEVALHDGVHTLLSTRFPIMDAQGMPYAVGIVATDITEIKRADQERAMLQQQVIDAQQAALRELSTPLLPLSQGVLAMPLVGTIDSQRAQQVMETLLEGIAAYQAQVAILDITGVQIVDTQVANALLGAAQAVKLLGADVVLTGIRPEVAQTLVGLGVDLTGIVTCSTLENGIAYALQRTQRG